MKVGNEKIIIIKSANILDLSRIAYLTKIAYRSPYKKNAAVTKPHEAEDIVQNFLSKKIKILVASLNGKIVGAIKCEVRDKHNLYLYQLAVLKTFRCLGVGKALIERVELSAKKQGCIKVLLDCSKEKHLDEYYKKLGYNIYNIIKHEKYTAIHMFKKIK